MITLEQVHEDVQTLKEMIATLAKEHAHLRSTIFHKELTYLGKPRDIDPKAEQVNFLVTAIEKVRTWTNISKEVRDAYEAKAKDMLNEILYPAIQNR